MFGVGYVLGMDTISLVDLGPVIAAVLGPVLAFAVVSMRYQHVDGTKTRELIAESREEARELITESREETRELIERSEKQTRELMERSREETRELIGRSEKQTRELIGRSEKQTRELIGRSEKHIDGLVADMAELKRDSKESFREVVRSLADARERLARMEGHLGVGSPRPAEAGEDTADAA